MNAVDLALKKAKAEGKTIQSVADAIGVTRVTIATWRKRGYVAEDFVMKFSDVLGVPPWTINKLAKEMAERLVN